MTLWGWNPSDDVSYLMKSFYVVKKKKKNTLERLVEAKDLEIEDQIALQHLVSSI